LHRGMASSAADAASRRCCRTLAMASLLAVVGVAALLLVLSSSVEAVSAASLLTSDSPWRNVLYAEVPGAVDKSAFRVHARLLRHSVRPTQTRLPFNRSIFHICPA
jgi:hypothetical protein